MTPRIFAALLLVWLAPLSVCAQQLPSTLRAEDQLRVLRSDGTTVKGSFLRTSGTVLELRANGVPLEIAEGAIQQIARRRPEPKWDGFLIGLAGGAATGFLVSRADCGSDSECKFYNALAYVPIASGIGAAAGSLIDFAIQKYDVVYMRPTIASLRVRFAPLFAADRKGTHDVRLILRFHSRSMVQ